MNQIFMQEALILAKSAAELGETPVGCVIVRQGEIIARGMNHRETDKTALGHAEIAAISEACRVLNGWRLWECELYVTLEPCPMCMGAIINARIPKVYFGASDAKNGAAGSVFNLAEARFSHKPEITGGILAEECAEVLRDFFKALRNGEVKSSSADWHKKKQTEKVEKHVDSAKSMC